jgi:HEAT repeat protein
MYAKTSPSIATLDSKIASSEAEDQKPVKSATAQAGHSQPAGKNVVIGAAAPAKSESTQLLLDELTSPDSLRRATAATALGRSANVAAVPALVVALRDADADVAREAAASLGLLGSASAVEPLIAVVENHDGYFHSVVRTAAIHSLGQLRDPRGVVPLLNAVKDPIAEASAEAIRALASLADPRSLPALLEVVRNEHRFFLATTRHAAILGLAQIGGEQAVCELRFVAANQWEDAAVRAAAIEVVGKASPSISPA